jgi:serine protease Do
MRLGSTLGGALFAAIVATASSGMALSAAQAANGPPSVAPVAAKLLDAVVNISTSQTLKGPQGIPLPKVPEGSPFEEFFKDFFDKRGLDGDNRKVNSLGSGFVIDPAGLIVTNNHVIVDADEIIINFNDGTKLKVEKVLGRDLKTDLALLKVVPVKPLPAVSFGDASKLNVGDWVMAIGNPFGLGGSVTVGIISAKKRDINSGPYDEFLQTDAAINKGNSGGPLFNMDGEVIGINTAIISPTGGSIGLGFAIPSNAATAVIDQLKQFGETRRGWIGVNIQTLSEEIATSLNVPGGKGALIAQVSPSGPGDKAGLKNGDVVVRFDGQPVGEMRDLPKAVAQTAIGKAVVVDVIRDGKPVSLTITVERLVEPVDVTPAVAKENPLAPKDDAPPPASDETVVVEGMTLGVLTDAARKKAGLDDAAQGVMIVTVKPGSSAAEKGLQAGEIISEVTNSAVVSPREITERLAAIKAAGRQSALLLVTDPKGQIRFVALPLTP